MIEGAKEQENEIEGGERRMLQTGFLLFELSWQRHSSFGHSCNSHPYESSTY